MFSLIANLREISDSSRRVREAEESRNQRISSETRAKLEGDAYAKVLKDIGKITEDRFLPIIYAAARRGDHSVELTIGHVSAPPRTAHHRLIDLATPEAAALAHILPGHLMALGFRVKAKVYSDGWLYDNERHNTLYLVVRW